MKEMIRVRIKKLCESARIPAYAHPSDAGMDLYATSRMMDEHGNVVYGTGLAFEIPYGYVGLIFPRSSNCKKDLWLTNHVGVIDSGYRGEVSFKFRPARRGLFRRKVELYNVGERVGQIIIMPYPRVTFEQTNVLSTSDRGTNGYGSTGK